MEYPNSMLARFRVRERIYFSVRFIFKISEVEGQPDGFSWLVKDRITSAQLKTLNSLLCFLQVQNCWRWLSLILSSSSTKKRDPDKIQVVLCSHAGFVLLSADGAKSNSFLICSLEIGFVWTTLAMMPVFLRAFLNALIIYFLVRDIGKRFVVRRGAKEMFNGDSNRFLQCMPSFFLRDV